MLNMTLWLMYWLSVWKYDVLYIELVARPSVKIAFKRVLV